jgi:hypothetical protein
MTYLYELPNATGGIDAIMLQLTVGSFYWFVPLMLLFVWFVVFGGGTSRQRVRTGTADYPSWAVISSIATLIIALLFSVTAGYIRLDWLVIVVVLNIFSAMWLFLDRKGSEV